MPQISKNPTWRESDESAVREFVREEAADVMVCIEALIKAGVFTHHDLTAVMVQKIDRWKFRIEEDKKN